MAALYYGGDAPGLAGALAFGDEPTLSTPDTTPPTLTGSITITGLTSTSYTATWPAGSDNVAVVAYERSLDGGSSWVDVGDVLTVDVTGRAPNTTDLLRVRAKDSAGNVSAPVLGVSVNLPPASLGSMEAATPGYIIRAAVKGGARSTVAVQNPGFSAKDPAELLVVGFDFSALTTAILSPAVTSTRHAGEPDETPEALLDGSPGYVGPVALQRVWQGVDGASYLLRCEVDDPDGNHLVLAGVLPVRAA